MDKKQIKHVELDLVLKCVKCGEIISDDYESKLKHWEKCLSKEDPEYATFSVHKKEVN